MCVSAYSHPKYLTGYAICVAVGRSATTLRSDPTKKSFPELPQTSQRRSTSQCCYGGSQAEAG